MANVNAQMKKVHKVAMDCIKHLVIVKKFSVNQAEDMVMQTLKESEHYLRNGMVNETISSLKMIHMDQTPEQAAKEMIKSLLK
jgi:hypothetical protein